jgi:hypothetical protein
MGGWMGIRETATATVAAMTVFVGVEKPVAVQSTQCLNQCNAKDQ